MSPSRAVATIGGAGGLLFALLTPPFQAPDEPVHFLRAYQISEGDLFADGPTGALLPASLQAAVERFDHLPFHPEARVAPGEIAAAFGQPLAAERRASTWLGAAAAYTPVPYLPQATGALAGRALGLPPVAILYLERLANLAACLLLAWTAVRLAPFAAWPLALIALLPMAAFLRGSASADALVGAGGLLAAAALLAVAFGPEEGRGRAWALFAAGSAVLVLSKGAYVLLPLAVLAVPPSRLGPRRREAAVYAGVLLLVAAGLAASLWTARRGIASLRPDAVVTSGEQARTMMADPLAFLALAGSDYVMHAPRYAAQAVGNLGWLDTPLPVPLLAGYALLLLGVALAGGSREVAVPARLRLLLAALAALSLLLVSVALYVTWTPAGAAGIEGIQGRYLIPLAPFVVPLLVSRRWARDLCAPRASWALFAAASLATAVALATLALRFYEL